MTHDQLIEIAQDATRDAELASADIPSIDLYVDQIINLVLSKLEEGSERHRSRVLTKTMINNYSKDGVIAPIKGKKYTREQIIQILCVYSLKNTLSISEIKRLLHGVYDVDGFGAGELTELYDRHQQIKEITRERAVDFLAEDVIESLELDSESDVDYVTAICALVSMSAYLKNIAQAMIEEKFPEPVDEKDESADKEKDKEKDKSKDKKPKEKDKSKEKSKKKKEKEASETEE